MESSVKNEMRRLARQDYGSFLSYVLKYAPAVEVRPTTYGNNMRVTISAVLDGNRVQESIEVFGYLAGIRQGNYCGLLDSADRWQAMIDEMRKAEQ